MKVKLNALMLIVTIQMNPSNHLKLAQRFIIVIGFTNTNSYGLYKLAFINYYQV